MAIDKNKLASIISGKAKALCSPQGAKLISEITNKNTGRSTANAQQYYDDYPDYDDEYIRIVFDLPINNIKKLSNY
mgnify:CR=1 FL=1